LPFIQTETAFRVLANGTIIAMINSSARNLADFGEQLSARGPKRECLESVLEIGGSDYLSRLIFALNVSLSIAERFSRTFPAAQPLERFDRFEKNLPLGSLAWRCQNSRSVGSW
jgi:hypothetical protein